MTIRLLAPYPYQTANRTLTIPAGSVVDVFDSDTEDGLVDAGLAEASVAAVTWTVPSEAGIYTGQDIVHRGRFADLPAAAAHAGALAAVTDLGEHGLCLLRSNGTHWRPVSPVTLVAMRSAAGEVVAAGGSETALGSERLLPAGLVQPGDLLRFMAWATCPTADTSSRVLSIRHGTSAGFTLTAGQRLARFTSVSSTNNDAMVDKVGMVLSDTQVAFTGFSDPGAKTNTTDLGIETVQDFSVDSYLRCSAQPTAGSAWTIYGMALQLIPGG